MAERRANLADTLGKYFQPKSRGQSKSLSTEDSQAVDMTTALVDAIVVYVLPRSLEGLRQKAGNVEITATGESIQAIRQTVEQKLKAGHREVLLTLAQADPIELHIQTLRLEVERQIAADPDFATHLATLVNAVHTAVPALQVALHESQVVADEKLIADADRQLRQLFA